MNIHKVSTVSFSFFLSISPFRSLPSNLIPHNPGSQTLLQTLTFFLRLLLLKIWSPPHPPPPCQLCRFFFMPRTLFIHSTNIFSISGLVLDTDGNELVMVSVLKEILVSKRDRQGSKATQQSKTVWIPGTRNSRGTIPLEFRVRVQPCDITEGFQQRGLSIGESTKKQMFLYNGLLFRNKRKLSTHKKTQTYCQVKEVSLNKDTCSMIPMIWHSGKGRLIQKVNKVMVARSR